MAAISITAKYTDLEGPGAIRLGRRLKWWFTSMTPDLRRKHGREGNHSKAAALRQWNAGDGKKWLNFLPWSDLPQEAFEEETEAVQHWMRHPHFDPWQLDADARNTAVPNFDILGWYDHCNGDMAMFQEIRSNGRTKTARHDSQLIVGPWSHHARGQAGYGNIRFGSKASFDLDAAQIRWFDYWL